MEDELLLLLLLLLELLDFDWLFLLVGDFRLRLEGEELVAFLRLEEEVLLRLLVFVSMEEDGARFLVRLVLVLVLVVTMVRVGVELVLVLSLVLLLEEGARLTTLAMILSPFACMALIGTRAADVEAVDSTVIGPACEASVLADRIRLLTPLDFTD